MTSTGQLESSLKRSHGRSAWWKTRRARRASMIAMLMAVIGVLIWWFLFHPYVSTEDARIAATTVRVAPAGVGGRVVILNVEEGNRVKKGDTLAEIDHRMAQSQVQRAKARAELTRREFARVERLASENSAPIRELDNARSNAEIAEAELKAAEVTLENTYLKSPIDGVVVQKLTEVGNILEPGQVAVTVVDTDNAWVNANIEETYVGRVKIGQPVKISVDEGDSLNGVVSEVRASTAAQFALIPSDSGAGNFTKVVQRIPIKVRITSLRERPLRVGQSVEISIRTR